MLTGNVTRISSAESALCSSWLLPKNRIKRWFRVTLLSQHHVLFFFSLPLKCYGCFPPLPSPLSAEVIFYPQESHYLASPSPPSSSLQLHRLTAILLCHSNLFFWHHYFALTHGLWACTCERMHNQHSWAVGWHIQRLWDFFHHRSKIRKWDFGNWKEKKKQLKDFPF